MQYYAESAQRSIKDSGSVAQRCKVDTNIYEDLHASVDIVVACPINNSAVPTIL